MEQIGNSRVESEGVKKTRYFDGLAKQMKSAFELHKNEGGLWEKKDGKREWGNVSEHCLVEVARVRTLGRLLGLPSGRIKDLEYAAALHDFSKRKEKELKAPQGGITWEQYEKEISEFSAEAIASRGFSRDVAILSGSAGHGSLPAILDKLKRKGGLSELDVACLAMYYVDNYTRGSGWVEPADGTKNEVDARTAKDRSNPSLRNLREGGKAILGGRDYTELMAEAGHEIEKILAEEIRKNKGIEIDPIRLPEYIDEEIKKEIENFRP